MEEGNVFEIILGGIISVLVGEKFYSYLKHRSKNKMAVELASISEDKELAERLTEALRRIQELELDIAKKEQQWRVKFTRAQTSIKMLTPPLKAYFKDKPEMLEMIEQAEKNISFNDSEPV